MTLVLATVFVASLSGCSTAPKHEDRAQFVTESTLATGWFEQRVVGLTEQLDGSAGYIVFPSVGQWGVLFGGGQFGRGLVADGSREQVGWAAVNTGSIGLQAGVRGFKMLMVFQDRATFDKFRDGTLSGSASGVAVAGEAGASGVQQFENGVAVYQGASTGLIAGVNVGLNYVSYEPLDRYE